MNFGKTILIALFIFAALPLYAQTRLLLSVEGPAPLLVLNEKQYFAGRADTVVSPGIYIVRAYCDRFRWDGSYEADTITVKGDEGIVSRHFAFQKAQPRQRLFKSAPLPPAKTFVDSELFKVLAGAFIISGGTATYLKHRADTEFGEYLQSKDAAALSRTKNLDRWSAAAFAGAQINFGLLVYFFLIN